MARQKSTTATGLRSMLLDEQRRSLRRWAIPGRRDELETALASGAPVEVSSATILKACMGAGLPHEHLAYGGQDHGKLWVLDERDRLSEVSA